MPLPQDNLLCHHVPQGQGSIVLAATLCFCRSCPGALLHLVRVGERPPTGPAMGARELGSLASLLDVSASSRHFPSQSSLLTSQHTHLPSTILTELIKQNWKTQFSSLPMPLRFVPLSTHYLFLSCCSLSVEDRRTKMVLPFLSVATP